MDDDQRVFDVSRPPKVSPPATSKPVIVGHRPSVNDPMVKSDGAPAVDSVSTPKQVPVLMGDEPEPSAAAPSAPADTPVLPHLQPHQPSIEPASPPMPPVHEDKLADAENEHIYTPLSSLIGSDDEGKPLSSHDHPGDLPKPDDGDNSHLVGSLPLPHPRGAGPKGFWRRVLPWTLFILLLLAAGAYLAIDAGWVGGSIKLPYDFIKNSNSQQTNTPLPAPVPTETTNTLPSGFTKYEIPNSNVSFAYPQAWGTAATTEMAGYSSRGTGKTSDGVHAYIVNFAKDKNIQVALTSSKLLAAGKDSQFSDFLQWCVGTVDGNIYYQTLHFNTTDGVDKPTTAVCDKGPLEAVTKLNDKTIVQVKFTDSDGKIVGDLYTLNLNEKDTPAFRVLDKSMDHISDVKLLLTTVQTN